MAGVGRVEIRALGAAAPWDQPMLVLQETGGARRCLPILIGEVEAHMIALAGDDDPPRRPMTHQLLADIVTALGVHVARVQIIAVNEGLFTAEVVLTDPAISHTTDPGPVPELTVAARPSDAVAVALRLDCPIDVADSVLDTASLPASTVTSTSGAGSIDGADSIDEQVDQLRDHLDRAIPDDFAG